MAARIQASLLTEVRGLSIKNLVSPIRRRKAIRKVKRKRRRMNLETLQNNIGNLFKSEDLLKEALTHRSYVNENAAWPFRNNERLEFLGDAVLELCVTEDLFERYGNREEGDMTIYRAALVNSKMLSRIAREIGLDKEILASKGEVKEIGNGGD